MSGAVPVRHVSPEAAGSLIAFLETGALQSRRYTAMVRLRGLRDSDDFPSLPEDLQQKIRDVLAASEQGRS